MQKNDLKKYPVFQYIGGKIVKLSVVPNSWNIWGWQLHHYVKQQQVKRHPELEQYQKLFFLPSRIVINGIEHNMHAELHNAHKDFEKLYGVKRSELLYGAKDNV